MKLEKLLYPASVAVVGASATPGKVGYAILDNLVKAGYAGTIVPINPKADAILGVKAYPDFVAYGRPIDLAVIAVPTLAVREAVKAAVKGGAQAVVVITAGFKEVGAAGAELEREIADFCRSKGVRLMGPNCLGVINTHHALNASFAKQHPRVGGMTVISQSGALLTAILDYAAMRHVGIAKMVSIGNKADLNEIDFLSAFADDDETDVIVGYLENITDGDAFVKAAEGAAAKKPVVIMKVGSTGAGQKAASSHTGSLAGADIAYGAAFARSGVIRADSFEALFDYAMALSLQPLPTGDRVAIITNAGGPGIMCADAVEKAGMTVAELTGAVATALAGKLPGAASVGNPIDVLGDADPERYVTALKAALEDDASVDAVIVILTPQSMTAPAETALALAANAGRKKPVLAVFMGGEEVMPSRAELVEHNLPAYTSPERAVAALAAMRSYAAWKTRPPRVVTRFPVNRRRAERIIARRIRADRLQVGEYRAKEILRAYGFNVPPGGLATGPEEAVDLAERIGYPVVMKVASPDIIHKSDFGGVRLNLANAEAVADAYDLITLRIKRRAPEARIDGVFIEKMADRGREVIIGMTRDPQFGPMLMFGLGGIFVEVMKDVTFHLAPITAEEALTMLKTTRSYGLLTGARGQSGVDLNAVAEGLQRISQLVTDFPDIAELDINPFIVGPTGTEPVVADARITLSRPKATKR
jgi:acetyltransferase